ncbi:MAG: urease accessory protein UreF [Thermoleophilaceae bacterium]
MRLESTELLDLLQVADSAFPIGSFSHSLGLESLAARGALASPADLSRTGERLLGALATSDLPAACAAHGAEELESLVAADHAVAATRSARESRDASAAMGRRMIVAAGAIGVDDPLLDAYEEAVRGERAPGSHPVAWGSSLRAMGVSLDAALHGLAFSVLAGFVAAGQKLIPLGQGAAQGVLRELQRTITTAVERSRELDPLDVFAFAPELEIASMAHERLDGRLFAS